MQINTYSRYMQSYTQIDTHRELHADRYMQRDTYREINAERYMQRDTCR